MKNYELTILYKPVTFDDDKKEALEITKYLIEGIGGRIELFEDEGTRRLTYPIHGYQKAIFCFYKVKLPPLGPSFLSSQLNANERVLRHLIVSMD